MTSPSLVRVVPLHDDVAPDQVLRRAAALAAGSSHPIATAIVAARDAHTESESGTDSETAVGKDGVVIGSTQALGVTRSPDGVAGQVRTAHSGPHLSHRVLLGTASWVLHELGLGAAAVETTPAATGTVPGLDAALSARLANAVAEAEREGATAVVVAWNGIPQAVLVAHSIT